MRLPLLYSDLTTLILARWKRHVLEIFYLMFKYYFHELKKDGVERSEYFE